MCVDNRLVINFNLKRFNYRAFAVCVILTVYKRTRVYVEIRIPIAATKNHPRARTVAGCDSLDCVVRAPPAF